MKCPKYRRAKILKCFYLILCNTLILYYIVNIFICNLTVSFAFIFFVFGVVLLCTVCADIQVMDYNTGSAVTHLVLNSIKRLEPLDIKKSATT